MSQQFRRLSKRLSGRASAPFIVLVTAICCAFCFTAFNMFWESQSEQRRIDALEQAEQQQVTGGGSQSARIETKKSTVIIRPEEMSYRDRKAAVERLQGRELQAYINTLTSTPDGDRLLPYLLGKIRDSPENQLLLQRGLVDAVKSSNVTVVRKLLEEGVDPNPLFLGKTLISIAEGSGKHHAAQIVEALETHGAGRDYLQLARQQRKGSKVAQCELANAAISSIDFSQLRLNKGCVKVASTEGELGTRFR